MAFSKIAGLEVTPRSESSRTSRSSSPLVISPRRIWSSQTLVPAAVSFASRSLTSAPTLMLLLLSRVPPARSCPRRQAFHHSFAALHDLLGREAEVLVEVLRRTRGAEAGHPDRVAVLGRPLAPAQERGRLDRDPSAYGRRQHAVAVVVVLLREAVEAGGGDHAGGD